MKNYFLLFIICVSYCISANKSYGQEFLKPLYNKENVTYKDIQKEFYDWSKGKDLNETKGWKYYKRWDDFNSKRAFSDGTLPDPEIYYHEVKKIQELNTSLNKDRDTNYNWIPVGIMSEAPSLYDWKETGIGRINCITFHPTDSSTFWVGIAQGGVWKTTNHGYSWIPLTDQLPMLRISDICVNPSNPDEIYISVGDYAYLGVSLFTDDRKRNTHYGIGVYKTVNGGESWEPTGLSFEQTDFDASLIRRVFIEENSDHLLAAGTNGIWKSFDAGDTWAQITEDLIWDIKRDPQNPGTIYASTGYVRNLDLGECGIIKSNDFGDSWENLSINIPATNAAQRIELAVSSTDPNYVYAVACDLNGGLYGFYQSTDAGNSWTLKATEPNILHWYEGYSPGGQGGYDLSIIVDANNNEKAYVGGINLWGTADGGSTWDGVSYWLNYYGSSLHADQHQLGYNPLDNYYYMCNDGGLYRTKEIEIGSWEDANNQSNYEWPTNWERLNSGLMVTSFYRLSLSRNNDGYVAGGTQDNSTFYHDTEEWYNIFGGDGFECIIHPDDPEIIYGSSQYGNLYKSENGGQDYDYISYYDIDEDGEWTTPFVMDFENPDVIYAGYGNVYKTINGGNSWSKISDFPEMPGFGQPNLCSSIALSKEDNNFMYIAKRIYHSFDEPGSAWMTGDGGGTWSEITANLPDSIYITYIATDDQNTNTAWVTYGGFYEGIKVFKTTNWGLSWENVSYNLPNLPVNCIVEEHGKDHNPVYIGMDVGIYYTNDTMNSWMLFNNDFPNVIVSELEIHEATNKIYAATFGRGIWKTDLFVPVADTSSGLSNLVYNIVVDIYPNPSDGKFEMIFKTTKTQKVDLSIIDISGRQVYSERTFIEGTVRKSFDLELMPGMYYAVISKDKYSKSVKFIIK